MELKDKRETLKDFFFTIRNCQKCDLYDTRTKFVFGGGSAYAEIMFVGEAPGKNEDLQGLPFVGQAGKILENLLASIGMKRDDVFIANVLKCRPPGNRDPRTDEIDICKGYLFRQIEIINPRLICTLGKYSTQLLLNTSQGITSLRGKMFRVDGRIIFPINHPAAALYTPSRMEILKTDFAGIKKIMDSYENDNLPVFTDLNSGLDSNSDLNSAASEDIRIKKMLNIEADGQDEQAKQAEQAGQADQVEQAEKNQDTQVEETGRTEREEQLGLF